MKKKLNIDAITNELEGASLFFTKRNVAPDRAVTPTPLPSPSEPKSEFKNFVEASIPGKSAQISEPAKKAPEKKSRKPDTTTPRNHETVVSRYHDTIIELVRRAVKELGKEAATHRFTIQEKRSLADIIYTYKNQGIRTSENEVARIAVNFIIEDYKENGKNSVLEKALKALNE